jgi:hypothetical protein
MRRHHVGATFGLFILGMTLSASCSSPGVFPRQYSPRPGERCLPAAPMTSSSEGCPKNAPPTRETASDGTMVTPLSAVAPSCLQPWLRPDTCSFYRECLEGAMPCESTAYPYAISYGEKYCRAFSTLSSLSFHGREWRDGTMRCLQEIYLLYTLDAAGTPRLADGTSAYTYGSCKDIQDAEFGGHAGCYLGWQSRTSKRTHVSICNLPNSDLLSIAWLVKGDALTLDGWSQMLRVGEVCLYTWQALSAPGRDGEQAQQIAFWKDWIDWAKSKPNVLSSAAAPTGGHWVVPPRPPRGSYQSSCYGCDVKKNTLMCTCKWRGGVFDAEHDLRTPCRDIVNCRGHLSCEENCSCWIGSELHDCGPSKHGGSCGSCQEGFVCDSHGQCVCSPTCEGRECGNNSCNNGSCGSSCPTEKPQCFKYKCCKPKCRNRNPAGPRGELGASCGPDGCGGSCGSCEQRLVCGQEGQCVAGPLCTCADGRVPLDSLGRTVRCNTSQCQGGCKNSGGEGCVP